MHLDHAITLVQARSCLAALADRAHTPAGTDAYERVLIDLDRLHRDECPALEPRPDSLTRFLLFHHATAAITHLPHFGIDDLLVELLLADLDDAYDLDED